MSVEGDAPVAMFTPENSKLVSQTDSTLVLEIEAGIFFFLEYWDCGGDRVCLRDIVQPERDAQVVDLRVEEGRYICELKLATLH